MRLSLLKFQILFREIKEIRLTLTPEGSQLEASRLDPHSIVELEDQPTILIPVMTTRQDESSSATKDNDLEQGITPQPASSSLDLLSHGKGDTYLKFGMPLIRAALNGDWDTARGILEVFPDAFRARITNGGRTLLHIAAAAKDTKFAIELVRNMNVEDLALKTDEGLSALCLAALSGQVEIAKAMVERNPNLIMLRTVKGKFPLSYATKYGRKDMTWFLYRATNDNDLTLNDRIKLLISMIDNNLYDVALDMLQNHPELATARDKNETALHALARKPLKASTFDNQSQKGVWWRRCTMFCMFSTLYITNYELLKALGHTLYSSVSGVNLVNDEICMHPKSLELVKCLLERMILSDNTHISELTNESWGTVSVAARLGNVDFLVALIHACPVLSWKLHKEFGSIFHIAVSHRHENIFVLINEMGAVKDMLVTFKCEKQTTILHMAGRLAPPSRLNIVSGAALQMQRELLWFKEVEKFVPPLYVEAENADGDTPRALFTKTHEGLLTQGEKWMKDTATSCMLVATLIATIMFAAAFTLPGGSNDTTGDPIYRKKVAFMFFAISDAIGLLSSSTAILTFLSILTSRFAEEDFLESLPKKLVIGIAMLFVSVAAMMVAFCSTFVIVFYHGVEWIAIPIALVACVPVISFGFLQYRLFSDIIQSIYRSRFLFRPTKHKLF